MTKTCSKCQSTFEITEDDLKFYDKMKVPAPTLCPPCRQQRRLSFRNERFLYHRKCDLCGKTMVSMFSDKVKFPVYCNECWWSDKWEAQTFGQNYDPSKSFFDQFKDLYNKVPKFTLYNFDQQNSDYCNYSCHNKDSYLVFGTWYSEKCLYGQSIFEGCLSCLDNLFISKCQYCANLVNCSNCYETYFSQFCDNCSSSWFLYDCRSCESCLFCTNLRNKKYYIFNEPATKEKYEEIKARFSGSRQQFAIVYNNYKEIVKNRATHKSLRGENNENVTGDYINTSRNIKNSYVIRDSQDLNYVDRTTKPQKDSMDTSGCCGELIYEGACVDFVFNSAFCADGEHYTDTQYSNSCFEVKNCFGCSGLRHKQYCILNKQYSKEEYEKLVPEIIGKMKKDGEYGEFFTGAMSPFGYNETMANEYWPLNKEEALKRDYNWQDDLPFTTGKETIIWAKIADNTKEVPESITDEVLSCVNCQKNYKITPQELAFYKQFSLPLPDNCPDCRHRQRLSLINPRKLYSRKCSQCQKEIISTYSAERPEKVYCEECYLKTVY